MYAGGSAWRVTVLPCQGTSTTVSPDRERLEGRRDNSTPRNSWLELERSERRLNMLRRLLLRATGRPSTTGLVVGRTEVERGRLFLPVAQKPATRRMKNTGHGQRPGDEHGHPTCATTEVQRVWWTSHLV